MLVQLPSAASFRHFQGTGFYFSIQSTVLDASLSSAITDISRCSRLGVFNFVVADAVQRLNEHHHRGNSYAGHFRGIVQTTWT
jgi:hypothetical protein